MQIRDNDTELIYGLFKSICEWALEKGYKDISAMKNLIKLAMVDVCINKHSEKSPTDAQITTVMDLGVSLRTVQRSLNEIDALADVGDGFIRIPQILRIILALLTERSKTEDELVREVSYLIHAPYNLQIKAVRSILIGLVRSGIIKEVTEREKTFYGLTKDHISLVNLRDKSAKMLGLAAHIDAYVHSVAEPLFVAFNTTGVKAKKIQHSINKFLIKIGTEQEKRCKVDAEDRRPFYFYFGSAPHHGVTGQYILPDAILEVLRLRFIDPNSSSISRTHWYYLIPAMSRVVFDQVTEFIEKEASRISIVSEGKDIRPYFAYLGVSDHAYLSTP